MVKLVKFDEPELSFNPRLSACTRIFEQVRKKKAEGAPPPRGRICPQYTSPALGLKQKAEWSTLSWITNSTFKAGWSLTEFTLLYRIPYSTVWPSSPQSESVCPRQKNWTKRFFAAGKRPDRGTMGRIVHFDPYRARYTRRSSFIQAPRPMIKGRKLNSWKEGKRSAAFMRIKLCEIRLDSSSGEEMSRCLSSGLFPSQMTHFFGRRPSEIQTRTNPLLS